jgi:hypothetical protein
MIGTLKAKNVFDYHMGVPMFEPLMVPLSQSGQRRDIQAEEKRGRKKNVGSGSG